MNFKSRVIILTGSIKSG